jgi:glycosyltransferase involved in cell wall biosynthesis
MQELAAHFREAGYRCVTSSFVKNRFLRVADMGLTLFRWRSELDLIVVQVFSQRAFIAADVVSFLAGWLDVPIIFCVSGGAFPEFLRQAPLWTRRVLSRAKVIVTPSHFVAHAIRCSGLSAEVLPHSLTLKNYDFRLRNCPKPLICWLRSYHSIYNPVDAVEAIALLKSEFPDIALTMLGPDSGDGSLDRVHAAIRNHNLNKNIRVIGSVPKKAVPIELSNHDIYLNTTSYESFGVAVMEAAATGLCIVSTDVGELTHLWKSEQSAMLVAPNSPKEIANAIRRLLTEPELGRRLSENARATSEKYDWQVVLPQWSRLVSRILEKSPRFFRSVPIR